MDSLGFLCHLTYQGNRRTAPTEPEDGSMSRRVRLSAELGLSARASREHEFISGGLIRIALKTPPTLSQRVCHAPSPSAPGRADPSSSLPQARPFSASFSASPARIICIFRSAHQFEGLRYTLDEQRPMQSNDLGLLYTVEVRRWPLEVAAKRGDIEGNW